MERQRKILNAIIRNKKSWAEILNISEYQLYKLKEGKNRLLDKHLNTIEAEILEVLTAINEMRIKNK